MAKICASGKPLGDFLDEKIYIGIKTAFNKAFVIDSSIRAQILAEDQKSINIIKPFLRGRDIKRWRAEFSDQYLIKIESSENFIHPWSGKPEAEAEAIFSKCYPAIYSYFQQYRDNLIKRTDQGVYFWELRSCSYWQKFNSNKVIWPDIAISPQFCWNESDSIVDMTAFIITGVEKWLLGILNSSVWFWYFSRFSSQIQNGYFRFKAQYCERTPIPFASNSQKNTIENLVAAVLATNSQQFEQILNGLVFELFFPQDLHAAKIHLFDACEQAGISQLAGLQGEALQTAAQTWADTVFATGHPIYAMLFDLQALDVVRTIEGKP